MYINIIHEYQSLFGEASYIYTKIISKILKYNL